MSAHNLYDQMNDKQIDCPTTGRMLYVPGVGYLRAWGTTDPTDEGYAKGCIFQNTLTGAIRKNTGTMPVTW